MQHAHPGASPKQAATHTVHAKPGEHAHAAYAAPKPHADTARHIAPPPPVAKPVAPAPPAHKPSAPSAHAPKPGPRLAPLAASKTPSHGGGQPLAPHIKEAIQNSLMVDLSSVRLHASTAAERKAQSLKARAFTFGNDIFLGHGEHPTDLTLITHEAAHVIQQQSASHVQAWSNDRGDRFEREADSAAAAVSRGETFAVRERVESPRVQRFGISDALDWLADKAYNIPGFRMFTIVLGVNPINMEHTDRSAGNVLRAVVEFIPGGALITQALDKYGVFDKVGNWVQQQLDTLGMIGSSIKQALMDFLDSLSWRDIFHLGDVWDRAKRIFTDPIDRIKDFVVGLLEGIWKFVREAILKPIASLASKTSGWDLLCAVMAKNPITGEAVPRTPDTLIGGFMKLIHEDEIWNNIKKANAVSRAFAWFQSVLSGLLGFVSQIPDLFIQALKSLEWSDILDLPGGFMKIVGVFGKFLGNFISWAGGKVWDLLQIIFEVVAPSVMPYLKKVGAAFKSILKNPMRFVHTLVDAAKLGFNNFRAHFVTHLLAGIIDWLTKSLSGVYIPKALSLPEFGKFALSVLGISWPQIRAKIVKALGPNGDSIMKGLETTFDVLVALFNGGPAAAWNLIQEKLTGLKDMVLDGIVSLAVDAIVKTAIPKLIAMFIPGAGFISAILSIYGTIKTFIEQLSKLAATVKAFLDSLVAMANGQIAGAAAKVESSLGGFLSLAISFLAGFFGLGNIASKVMGVIEKVRAAVDKALDVAINFIVGKAKALFAKLFGKKDDKKEGDNRPELVAGLAALDQLTAKYNEKPESKQDLVSDVAKIRSDHKVFSSLTITERDEDFVYVYSASAQKERKGPLSQKKIRVYEAILTKLSLPLIKGEKDADQYREKMRAAIVKKYKSMTVGTLNKQVFQSDAIPAAQNRIRGDIFELWLQENGVMDRQSPVFDDEKYKELAKKRIADGIRGTALVESKVRRPGVAPSPSDESQMEDYAHIINNARIAVNQGSLTTKGPFTKVIYIISDKSLIKIWEPILKTYLAGIYQIE